MHLNWTSRFQFYLKKHNLKQNYVHSIINIYLQKIWKYTWYNQHLSVENMKVSWQRLHHSHHRVCYSASLYLFQSPSIAAPCSSAWSIACEKMRTDFYFYVQSFIAASTNLAVDSVEQIADDANNIIESAGQSSFAGESVTI